MRRPTLRALAVALAVLSAWTLSCEACALTHLLPSPLAARLPRHCPAPVLHAVLARRSPAAAFVLDGATLAHVGYCVCRTLGASKLLAPLPLVHLSDSDILLKTLDL